MKLSFVELYNEELRDFLTNDLSAPTAFTQPMGMAAKDAKAADGGLKLFDESNKRGSFIQGLEEIASETRLTRLTLLLSSPKAANTDKSQQPNSMITPRTCIHSSLSRFTLKRKITRASGDDLLKVGKPKPR